MPRLENEVYPGGFSSVSREGRPAPLMYLGGACRGDLIVLTEADPVGAQDDGYWDELVGLAVGLAVGRSNVAG